MAACSPHFETLFSHPPVTATNNNQFFVILDGTRADDLVILLHFMYRGEAYLHHDRINSVLRTAEVLQVKGLSEGPQIVNPNSQQHGTGVHSNERGSSAGGSTGGLHPSTSSAARSWTPPLHANSEIGSAHPRSGVGIMGNKRIGQKDRDRGLDSRIDYHHHSLHRLERDREMEISSHPSGRGSGRPGSPDHGVSPPYSYPPPRENFGHIGYGGSGSSAFRGNPPPFPGPSRHQDACSSSNREYSPNRDTRRSPAVNKSNTPPPGVAPSRSSYQQHGGPQPSKYTPSPPPQAHGQPTSDPLKDERDRDGPYDLAGSSSRDNRNGPGSNSGNLSTRSDPIVERQTPSDRHTPAHGSAGGGDLDQRSIRNSPSPAATPASHVSSMGKVTPSTFPSDSTTDVAGRAVGPNSEAGGRGLIRSASYKDERIRRLSDAASDIGPSRTNAKFEEFQGSRVDLQRIGSPNRAGKHI